MSDPIIKINPSKPTDLDFEVSVQTNCADDKPCVRFGVELEPEVRWMSLVCKRDDETKRWSVTIPALKPIVDRNEYPFILEVILEDYYFVPARGTLQPLEAPTASLTPSSSKPTVTASFSSSADTETEDEDNAEEKDEKEEKLEERAPGAGTAFEPTAPTNKLLKPEFPPATKHVEQPKKDNNNPAKVASKVTPGEQGMTADTVAQSDGKGEFDARQIAQQIVQSRSKVKKPEGKGSLFKRIDGKAVVEGLEPKEIREALDKKAKAVKDILKK